MTRFIAHQLADSHWFSHRKAQQLLGYQPLVSTEEGLARLVPVHYPVGPAICRHYAEQATRLKAAGTPIGANDLWIASHALAEDATLVTHNTREFARVSGLRIEDWVETSSGA